MRLFTLGATTIRIHPLFPFMLLFLVIKGEFLLVSAYLFVLFLHEAGHYAAAHKMKLPVSQIEITPFGGSMQIALADALPPVQAFFLSASGPAMNCICLFAGIWARIYLFPASQWLLCTLSFHTFMLTLNLLPVLPLDGGRMLLAFLSGKGDRDFFKKLLLSFGRILSLLLIAWGAYQTLRGRNSFSFCLLGFYLLYAAALEEKTGASRYLAAFISRRTQLEKQKTLPIQYVSAAADMPLFMLIPHLRPGCYHIVEVLESDGLTSLGVVREETLLSAILHPQAFLLKDLL